VTRAERHTAEGTLGRISFFRGFPLPFPPESENAAARLPSVVSPIRLVLLSLLFALPISGVAWYQYGVVSTAAVRLGTEEDGVHFVSDAVRLLEKIETLPLGRPITGPRRIELEQRLTSLDDRARAFTEGDTSDADVTKPVQDAWHELVRNVSPATLRPFEDALQHMTALISDASELSFEANVVEADLQDAAFDMNPHVLRWLTLADATASSGAVHGRVPVGDRIALAGMLAQASVARGTLDIDVDGAFDNDPTLKATLWKPWTAFNADANPLWRRLEDAMQGKDVSRDAGALSARGDRLVADSAALTDAMQRELETRLRARMAEAGRMHVLIVVLALLAALLSVGIIASISRAIVGRDRRELHRVQQEAQMLSTELARQHAERALQLTEAQFRAVFDRSHMGIALLDAAGETIESNAAVSDLLGPGARIIAPGDREFRELAGGRLTTYVFEREVRREDGSVRWAEVNVSIVAVTAPSSVAAVAMVRDVTERKAVDDRLRYAATHDQVTSLPNRTEFVHHLEGLIARRPSGSGNYAVLFIDLDDFKVANDRFGHHAGDRLLVVTARRLLSLRGPTDLVARFHGDEFAVLLGSVGDGTEAFAIAQHVQDVLRAPVQIDGHAVSVTSSVGVVVGNDAYVRAEDVVRNADAAMYHAKSLGRGMAVLFDEAMQHRLALRMRLITDLQAGLGRGEFHLAYQPVVDLRSGEPDGLEALMRWRHPLSGSIPPSTFISLAEESGAIIELGRFALRESCTMLARDSSHAGPRPLTMNVNLSVTQLMEPSIVEHVADALGASGLPPERLMLEITESALLEDGPRAAAVLGQLKALGVRLCIDDFGTGYSSLRYLHKFPIDALKIDRSFVSGASGDIANEPIVQMVVTLGHSLHMDVIAEGIETETQRRKLMALGCKSGQGYLFSRPIDHVADLEAWLGTEPLAKSS
jgi:diguanylate cyclase (GGDEF)-like protein/PAS domain S-box-containing protein